MTIKVLPMTGTDEFAPEDAAIRIWVIGRTDLLKLQALLDRALNCAPEFGSEWFELSDRLNQFLTQQNIK
jgi:hypothetical protein